MQARFIRNLLVLCAGIALCNTANAQQASRIYVEPNGWSIGTNVGMSDLWGDVGTKSPLAHYANSKYFDKVAFMGGIFGRYSVHPCFAVRFSLNYGSLFTTDKYNFDLAEKGLSQGEDAYQRYARGQNAKCVMAEGSFMMELTPFRFNPESAMAGRRGQVYLAAGIALFHFTPYSTVAASPRYVETYPLRLEGQGFGAEFPKLYSLWQPAIPLAIGYRWDLGQHLNLGIEYMFRMTFTDYLDGVSGKYVGAADFAANLPPEKAALAIQVADKGYYLGLQQPNAAGNLRGNPDNNDGYSTISISLYYKVLSKTRSWWRN